MNRLANATSPYLLQHANNPVHWQPWDDEALARAREQDKPLLISIGYAACHWCHVMERESFEDEATAAIMNDLFVPIKVDREERPDIDAIYMTATQAMTGHGGWPMTVFATPDGRPFFTGTYFPPEDRHGMPSFQKLMHAVNDAWTNRRAEIEEQSASITAHISQIASAGAGAPAEPGAHETPGALTTTGAPGRATLFDAAATILEQHDKEWGGFGDGMKFPNTPLLEFMLRMQLEGDDDVGAALRLTLQKMARGGIFDHVGGGFHRYTVDRIWLVPHFEKMLYDNAQLLRLYARAWQVDRDPLYRETAERTAEWMLREMRADGGGFFSSLDADSEGVEGKFYVWPFEELIATTGDDMPLAIAIFAAAGDGNWEGTNVIWRPHTDKEVAEQTGTTPQGVADAFARVQQKLFDARSKRVRPATDDKVLAAWNGLAIAALAEAGRALKRSDFVDAAATAARFVLQNLRTESGALARSWRAGRTSGPGFLDDYAMMGDACLTLYETTFDPTWFEQARTLATVIENEFAREDGAGFYDTPRGATGLVFRPRDIFDNATPSGNAVASDLLLRLAALDGNDERARTASRFLDSLGEAMARQPLGFGAALSALDRRIAGATEIAIVGDGAHDLIDAATGVYLPNRVIAAGTPGPRLLEGRTPVDGKPAAYVCRNFACDAPVTDASLLAAKLGANRAP